MADVIFEEARMDEGKGSAGEWTITVHGLMCSDDKTSIYSTFRVSLSPSATVEEFLKQWRTSPGAIFCR